MNKKILTTAIAVVALSAAANAAQPFNGHQQMGNGMAQVGNGMQQVRRGAMQILRDAGEGMAAGPRDIGRAICNGFARVFNPHGMKPIQFDAYDPINDRFVHVSGQIENCQELQQERPRLQRDYVNRIYLDNKVTTAEFEALNRLRAELVKRNPNARVGSGMMPLDKALRLIRRMKNNSTELLGILQREKATYEAQALHARQLARVYDLVDRTSYASLGLPSGLIEDLVHDNPNPLEDLPRLERQIERLNGVIGTLLPRVTKYHRGDFDFSELSTQQLKRYFREAFGVAEED